MSPAQSKQLSLGATGVATLNATGVASSGATGVATLGAVLGAAKASPAKSKVMAKTFIFGNFIKD